MLTLKRRCVFAQAVFDLVDESGEWVGEVPTARMLITTGQEKELPRMVDKMLEQVCEELIAKGQPVRMGPGRWQVSGGVNGEDTGLSQGIRHLPRAAGSDQEPGEQECCQGEGGEGGGA